MKTQTASKKYYIEKVKDVYLVVENGDYEDRSGKLVKCALIEFARSYDRKNAEIIAHFLNKWLTGP